MAQKEIWGSRPTQTYFLLVHPVRAVSSFFSRWSRDIRPSHPHDSLDDMSRREKDQEKWVGDKLISKWLQEIQNNSKVMEL